MTTQDVLGSVALALPLVSLTVFLQATITVIVWSLYPPLCRAVDRHPGFPCKVFALLVVVHLIIGGHLLQIHLWAAGFYIRGFFDDYWISEAFAAQTYTTLGYGDILLPAAHRTLAGWLAITGLLMVGWSTALFASLLGRYQGSHATGSTVP